MEWNHLPSKWTSTEDKRKLHIIDQKQVQDKRVLDAHPQPFFLFHHRLGEQLYHLRAKIVLAFREINHTKPLIPKIFGSDSFIGIESSGDHSRGLNVDDLKADSKKRKRQDFDVEYQPTNTSSQRNLRRKTPKRTAPSRGPVVALSSSDTDKILNIKDILLQAKDERTGQMKVFVEWDDRAVWRLPGLLKSLMELANGGIY